MPDLHTPEWWRTAARKLPKDSPGRAYCRIMAVVAAGHGSVTLTNDTCFEMAGDDAVATHAHHCADSVMEEEDCS